MYRYAGDTFEIIQTAVRLIGSYIVLVYFNVHAAYIVFFIVALTISAIVQFDKVLVRQYRVLFRAENKISAKIFDVISNITTVIILRIEGLVSSSMWQKIIEPLGLYMQNRKVNEAKWFFVSMCSAIMVVLVLASYFWTNISAGTPLLIGTVYILYGYVGRIKETFWDFASIYNEIVRQKASVMNAEEIANDFAGSNKVAQVALDSNWREIKIDSLSFSYHAENGAHLPF